jgi:Coenzyme PQQ synthesis protein D (PqqD)
MLMIMDRMGSRDVVVPAHVRHVDDDLKHVVVMDTQSGKIFGLDNSAALMWRALAETGSESRAAAAVVEGYGIDHGRAATDVHTFLSALLDAGLLVREGASE